MNRIKKQRHYSASDITLFMKSPFASWMDRYVVECPEHAPERDPNDGLIGVLQQKGFVHENKQQASFEAQGVSVLRITGETAEEKNDATWAAMKNGINVIVQARLENKPFMGYADFLVKVAGNSHLGDYHYEVWDTKLAHKIKPEFVMQLSCYTDMLESMQGKRPHNMRVVLGNCIPSPLRVDDYVYYYHALKELFLTAQQQFDSNQMPDPSDSKDWGNWSNYATALLRKRDHLFQVAGITRSHIKKLNKASIQTMEQLINSNIQRVPGINSTLLDKLKMQATLQKASIGQSTPLFTMLPARECNI